MNVITKKEVLAGVAARWDRQYGLLHSSIQQPHASTATDSQLMEWERKSAALHALPPGVSEADIAAIIGNRSWTELRCDECGERVDALVQVGDEPDYESATVRICLACAEKAVAALRGAP